MAKFPEPPGPAELSAVRAAWVVLPAGYELWRIYARGGPYPARWNGFRAFGPVDARFDHHEEPPRVQDRGILYAAERIRTCLAEFFQHRRHIDTGFGEPWLVGFALTAPVRLLDLAGTWPTRAGASMAINSGPRSRARRWARAIYAAYPATQGLHYASSMDGNAVAVALFERAEPAMPVHPFFHRALADPLLLPALAGAADDLGYTISGAA